MTDDPRAAELPAMGELAAAMHEVRGGCVWSASMTHESLLRYLLEESHEFLEAVQAGDSAGIREELGDLLLQVVFHAEIAEGFDLNDVAAATRDKMIRRHPHVFGSESAGTVAEVESVWGAAKAREKADRAGLLAGIAPTLPGLARAQKVASRLARSPLGEGVDAPVLPDTALPEFADEAELGELLYAIARRSERLGLDAESALQGAVGDLARKIAAAEAAARD